MKTNYFRRTEKTPRRTRKEGHFKLRGHHEKKKHRQRYEHTVHSRNSSSLRGNQKTPRWVNPQTTIQGAFTAAILEKELYCMGNLHSFPSVRRELLYSPSFFSYCRKCIGVLLPDILAHADEASQGWLLTVLFRERGCPKDSQQWMEAGRQVSVSHR